MKDLNELQIFTQVAQEMSFTRAAATLEISKAAVSRAILSLENRLATRLFERTTRRLILTEAGETYLSYAKRAMEEADDGEAAISTLTGQPRGTLRLVMPCTIARSAVAPQLARFLQSYPELVIELTMLPGGQADPIAQRVDLVFQTVQAEPDINIVQKRMTSVELGIYASKQYLKTAPPLHSPQDLVQHSCLTLTTTRGGAMWTLWKDSKEQEVRLRGRVSVADPVIHHRLCLDGVGIAILPVWLVEDDVRKKRLQRLLPGWTPNPTDVYVLYPARLSMMPKINLFIEFMEALAHSGSGIHGATKRSLAPRGMSETV